MCLDWIGIAFNTCLQLVFNGQLQESSNHIWGWVLGVLMDYFNDEEIPTAALSTPNSHFIIDPLDLNHMQCEGLFKNVFDNFMDGLKRIPNEPNIFNNNDSKTMLVHPSFIVVNALIVATSIVIFIYTKIIKCWKAYIVEPENPFDVDELKINNETVTFLQEIEESNELTAEDEICVKDEINVENETNEENELDFIPLYLKLKEEQILECVPNLGLQVEAKKLISFLERPKKTQNPLIIKPLKLKSITNIVQPKEANLKISKASLRHSSIPLRSKTMDLK